MITKKELQEIKERESKATKGPWQRGYPDGSGSETILADEAIAVTNWGCSCCQGETTEQNEADAEFIARSKQDIPRLIETLEAAVEVIETISKGHTIFISNSDAWLDKNSNDIPVEIKKLATPETEKARDFLKQWEGKKL